MVNFTQNQLDVRKSIIDSHTRFGKFLDSDITNKLINIFTNGDIIKYIKDERKAKGLNNAGIKIKTKVSGTKNNKSSLYLNIEKNGKHLVHLSIHLIANKLNSKNAGLIHFYKNIFDLKTAPSKKPLLYALIKVEKPANKPKSLEFSIANGYTTNQSIQNADTYNPELHQEMDVIITVLNRLFDEKNTEFYVGFKNYYINDTNYYFTPLHKFYPIHNQTNNILQNINNHSRLTKRKNKGVKMLPILSQAPPLVLPKTTRATTRKVTRRNVRNLRSNTLEVNLK
jgi:hypothetical protein